ncbi:tRNA glutamyl-Q(34) synthetase GluQRS [Cohnella thermotolerans]|jgi:glutamyl-tRNA synthetase|uniref:tRNA glutamyl-Q(34) synthetase GluQRS n=1 Tax=Cohnella thermotolerans TaxID=329858 RepID=UPI0003FC4E02|nr:tRNA glutamyl-Q(34) synthetase GluQRS [Cohnella thermotolerans]
MIVKMSSSPVRGRFAPTPSGRLHLGNAATALLAWLQVRAAGGTMILRMEDLDGPRCKPGTADLVMEEMVWLGLDWDEGPDVGGPYGPYEQSARLALYEAALERLRAGGFVYPCYCSRAELQAIASAPHGLASEGGAYDGRCRRLSPAERRAKEALKTPSVRFALPDRSFSFVDGVAGPLTFGPGAGGDFVVKRADGIVGYQLAVVVDDIAMGVTDVFRGWDLLDSTPRQLALYEAFGERPPRFAHGPLLLGPDGSRLSKRHGSVAVSSLREQGVRPERLTGWLAWLTGLTDKPEPMTPPELIPLWNPERIIREAVRLPADWTDRLKAN